MLTDMQCRKAAKKDKPYKLADALGLHLYVTSTGFRSWRLKYQIHGKEKRLIFGAYPHLSDRGARYGDSARKHLHGGKDPLERHGIKNLPLPQCQRGNLGTD